MIFCEFATLPKRMIHKSPLRYRFFDTFKALGSDPRALFFTIPSANRFLCFLKNKAEQKQTKNLTCLQAGVCAWRFSGVFSGLSGRGQQCVQGWGGGPLRKGQVLPNFFFGVGVLVRPPGICLGLSSAVDCVFGYRVQVKEYETSPLFLPLLFLLY